MKPVKKYHTRVHESEHVKVKDADRPLYFIVDDESVYAGHRRDKNHCVLACALRERIPSAVTVEVGSSITKIRYKRKIVRYATPSSLRRELRKWDQTGRWQLPPGSYHLNPVPEERKLGARRQLQSGGPRLKTIARKRIPGTKIYGHPTRWVTI